MFAVEKNNEKSKNVKIMKLAGVIIDPGKYKSNESRKIVIRTVKGNDYKCFVPKEIFSNFHEDDCIECRVFKNEKSDSYTLSEAPFTQFPVTEEAIQRCFIRCLRGTGFGGTTSEILYNGLKDVAKRCGYKPKEEKVKVVDPDSDSEEVKVVDPDSDPEEVKVVDPVKTQKIPGIPAPSSKIKLKKEIVGTDGVISLLTVISTLYAKNSDKDSVMVLTNCGITTKQSEKLLFWWYKSRSIRRLHLLGFSNVQIRKCRMNHDEIYQIVLENPYKLAPLNIEKCAEIMAMLNRTPTKLQIKCGTILRKIYEYVDGRSWCCVPVHTMEYNFKDFFKFLAELQENYGVILDGKLIYLDYNYEVENNVSEMLNDLIISTAKKEKQFKEENVDTSTISQSNMYELKTLTDEQKTTIDGALRNDICVITGGAGTGKSTICREIYRNLKLRGVSVAACAFTGKAVSRLNQAIGEKIGQTMDLMICTSSNFVKFQVVIMDEASMVTTELFYRFKCAFPHFFKLIIVGDCDQLPPISWGFFMKQVISSERVPVYTLSKNQRIIKHTMTEEEESALEKDSSGITPSAVVFDRTLLENCENLIDKKRDHSHPMEFKEGNGFYIIDGGINTIPAILSQVKTAFSLENITCISPYNEFLDPINEMFQKEFLKGSRSTVDRKGRTWKVDDRVMMLKNNYNINIMNGEEGIVTDLTGKGVVVNFNGSEHTFLYASENESDWKKEPEEGGDYNGDELTCDMIRQSFCITVHKSQGSEYMALIIFIPERYTKNGRVSSFLNINLLYTALTRTRRVVWVVTKGHILNEISINKAPLRYDNLCGRLIKMKDEELEKVLEDVVKIKRVNEFTAIKEEETQSYDDDDFVDDDFWEQ